MIDSLNNFLSGIQSFISSVADWFEGMLNGLKTLFKLIPMVSSYLISSISHLPAELTIFATVTITICIVYLIVGRETGS